MKVAIFLAKVKVGGKNRHRRVIIPSVVCVQNFLSIVFLTKGSETFNHVTIDFAT
jgi:hypothetical protein